jgi:NADH-quinone oxidoreductase subunit M
VVIITPVVIIASWRDFDPTGDSDADTAPAGPATIAPKYDARVFFALVLAVQSCALYLFLATDVFLFYVFFEVILVPMYFLIGGFGPGPRRTYAAAKFLIFGLLGGFVMLASVIGLYVQSAKAGQPSYLLGTLSQLDIATGTAAGCSWASCSPLRSRRRWCRCIPGCRMRPRSLLRAARP